jgi:hypothetical protein
MNQIKLRINVRPTRAEAIIKLHRKDGGDERITVVVDTGAQTSLLPRSLLDDVEHQLGKRGSFIVEQAGIARQTFEAVEAMVKLSLEDQYGGQTQEWNVPVWFADTDRHLLGFRGVLNRAVIHIDAPNLSGYLEFPD